MIEKAWAGVIAAERRSEVFLSGYCVIEEILGGKYRGKGFAPAVQRMMIENLELQGDEMIFGHISLKNSPSLRTASRVGRSDVGGYLFVRTDREKRS